MTGGDLTQDELVMWLERIALDLVLFTDPLVLRKRNSELVGVIGGLYEIKSLIRGNLHLISDEFISIVDCMEYNVDAAFSRQEGSFVLFGVKVQLTGILDIVNGSDCVNSLMFRSSKCVRGDGVHKVGGEQCAFG